MLRVMQALKRVLNITFGGTEHIQGRSKMLKLLHDAPDAFKACADLPPEKLTAAVLLSNQVTQQKIDAMFECLGAFVPGSSAGSSLSTVPTAAGRATSPLKKVDISSLKREFDEILGGTEAGASPLFFLGTGTTIASFLLHHSSAAAREKAKFSSPEGSIVDGRANKDVTDLKSLVARQGDAYKGHLSASGRKLAAAWQKDGLQVALNPKDRMRVAESLEVSDVLLQLTIKY